MEFLKHLLIKESLFCTPIAWNLPPDNESSGTAIVAYSGNNNSFASPPHQVVISSGNNVYS